MHWQSITLRMKMALHCLIWVQDCFNSRFFEWKWKEDKWWQMLILHGWQITVLQEASHFNRSVDHLILLFSFPFVIEHSCYITKSSTCSFHYTSKIYVKHACFKRFVSQKHYPSRFYKDSSLRIDQLIGLAIDAIDI
jgi:hypothetical protein